MLFNQDELKNFDFSLYASNIKEAVENFEKRYIETRDAKVTINVIKAFLADMEKKIAEIESGK